MDRRYFLRLVAGSVVVIPVAGSFLVSCGGEADEYGVTNGDTPAAAPRSSGGMVTYTTNLRGDHAHEFTVQIDAFASPPADGVSGFTSTADAHSHGVAVSMSELASVQAGQTVKITTGVTEAHSHVITLLKLSSNAGTGSEADAGPGGGGGGGGGGTYP